MASSGGKDSSSPIDSNGRVGREHSNPEAISALYEDLFENDNSERPCYLPDSGQEDYSGDGDGVGDGDEDGNSPREIVQKGRGDSVVEEKGELNAANGASPEASATQMNNDSRESGSDVGTLPEDLDARSSTGNEDEIQEKDHEFNFRDRVRAESSSTERLVHLDGEMSSDRGLDGPPSPTSSQGGTSGYMAGSGSSSASTSSVSGVEIGTDQDTEGIGSRKEERGVWVPGKRHSQEDDSHPSWRRHKKHFFILSNAGKPIYSRYGDEHKLAGFSATLQAIMSFVENSGDTIHLVRAGDHQIIFLVRGPLYLVCISSTDEPFQVLKGQLELLHGQLLLILTKAVEKCFLKNSKFDMRPLLGGTDVVFSSLIHAFSWDPATFLSAYSCLPLPYVTRQAACGALQDMTDSGVLFALLMCGTKVISLVGPRKASLHPHDLLLLSNFILSSDSFRTSESFSPVCLPRYNATAFMYAYVQYLNKDTCLILLTGDPNDFFHLKECRAQIEIALRESDVLREVNNSISRGGLRIEDLPDSEDLVPPEGVSSREDRSSGDGASTSAFNSVPGAGGAAGLWHFIYRSTYLDQFVASEFSPPLNTRSAQKRLYRAFQKLHASMHDTEASGPHKMQYRRDENHVLLSWRNSDFELYAAFDPLAEKKKSTPIKCYVLFG
ncbi:hypothetical protein AXG93_4877s1020 [Marchantia polymorpha subsp. ruderalis]|uniref:Vacuolar fusion protein MON1 homolog n=1 Tax=Marchantia polymorpha subsp. ruderalis TaxID=1480154 RepID=A0A176WD43_MARPO|nr:hypothetical protein AXG93_4877s1020 [Marchantia polymorpha subsp. ruderalis]